MQQALGDAGLAAARWPGWPTTCRSLRPGLDWGRRGPHRGDAAARPTATRAGAGGARRPGRAGRPARPGLPGRHPGRRRRRGGRAAARPGPPPTTSRRCASWSASCAGRAGWSGTHDGLDADAQGVAAPRRDRPAPGLRRSLAPARRGEHEDRAAGAAGEPTGAWRPWAFGDEQPLDVVRTVAQRGAAPGRSGTPRRRRPARIAARGRGLRGGRDRAPRRRRGGALRRPVVLDVPRAAGAR